MKALPRPLFEGEGGVKIEDVMAWIGILNVMEASLQPLFERRGEWSSPLCQHFLFVTLHVGDVFLAHGHVVLHVEIVVDGTEREGLLLFKECQTFKPLAFILIPAQDVERFEEGLQQTLWAARVPMM